MRHRVTPATSCRASISSTAVTDQRTLRRMRGLAGLLDPVLLVSEIRTVAADNL
jgi:hypothetical protein